MSRNKLKRYTGAEVAQPKSIAEQLLAGTKLGNLLYGKQETYKDGNNQETKDATFNESANGQMVQRMGETAKDVGNLALTGLSFGNPLTASNAMAPLIAGSQAYWIGHGINDGAQRIENIGEGVKNFVEDPSWQNAGAIVNEVPMLALDAASALPVARTVAATTEQVMPTVRNASNKASNYLKKQYASHVGAKIINSEVNQFPKQKWMLDQYNDHDFIFNEFSDPNSAVHVTPNPIVGKNVTEKASRVSGTSLIPGSAERSLVGNENMIWLWDGKPYRAQWNDQTFISIPKTNGMAQTRQSGAVGVPEIDLTAPTTKIITRNPITDGFERHIVVSGPEPITPVKIHYNFFERPSTYFKDATYAGTPGTYAGKEVPIWQLPKGQRNQPHNPTATERIYSVLDRDPNVQTGGIDLSTLADTPQNQTLLSMRDFLGKHGVDTKNITLDDLETLYRKRLSSIKSASNDNYNLALPRGEGAFPKKWDVRAFDQEGLVGRMSITGPSRKQPDMLQEIWEKYHKSHPGTSVDMIENNTRIEIGSKKIPGRSPVKGVSQRLYDAGIPVAQQTNNGQGLMSGEMYLQPQRSTAVMEHYPTKQIIRNNGEWHWENLDPTKVTTKNNPVYLLPKPSGKYIHIPTKSSSFFPSAIRDGQVSTNINHGSIFLEDGGEIENPDQ